MMESMQINKSSLEKIGQSVRVRTNGVEVSGDDHPMKVPTYRSKAVFSADAQTRPATIMGSPITDHGHEEKLIPVQFEGESNIVLVAPELII